MAIFVDHRNSMTDLPTVGLPESSNNQTWFSGEFFFSVR